MRAPTRRRVSPLQSGLLVALSALFTGCVATAPPTELGIDAPAAWQASEAPDAGAPIGTWWERFGDERLSGLVEEALASNHDLAAAARRIDAAIAQSRIAGAPRKPTLGVAVDAARRRQNFIGLPIPGSDSNVLSTTSNSFGANLNVAWEVDLWGRLGAAAKASLAELDATRSDYRATRLSIAGQTTKAWFAVVEAWLQVDLARSIVAGRESTQRRIQNRFERGLRDALDLRLANSNLAQAEADLAARQLQLDAATRQLEVLLGRYPAAALESAVGLPIAPAAAAVGVPSDILLRRPDLAAADARLEAAGFRVSEARAALYPRLTLSGSSGRSSDRLADLTETDFSIWSLAANLLQPVFQGGRLRAGVAVADANQRAALEGYRGTILRAFAEVESALAAQSLLAEQAISQAAAATSAVASQNLAERRYESGLSDYLTVLTSQIQAQQAQSRLLSVRRQRLDAQVDLMLALGSGLEETTTPVSNPSSPDESDPIIPIQEVSR